MSERIESIKAKAMQRKINKEIVTKTFESKLIKEEASFEATQKYNVIQFTTQRKSIGQTRGKEVSFDLDKKEVEELRDYLTKALENWDEWNGLDKF